MSKKPPSTATGRIGFDFSKSTKELIAKRATYRCVVPGCEIPTIGPGASSGDIATTGTACHIFSAGEKGPRGRAGLSPQYVTSPENGVWACGTHGRLIDTNKGDAYPATLLQAWKDLQEAQIRKERDHQSTNVGWVDEISIQNSFLFEDGSVMKLGKLSMLQGPSIGKTAICDWLATSLGEPLPNRWRSSPSPILTRTIYYAPEKSSIELTISNRGPKAEVNSKSVREIPRKVSAVHIRETAQQELYNQSLQDDDEHIAKIFGIDRTTVRSLTEDIQRHGNGWGRTLEFYDEPACDGENDDGDLIYSETETVVTLRYDGANGVPLAAFSGSEHIWVLLEFACALARERAQSQPVILVLDSAGWSFDRTSWDAVGRYISDQPCQVLLTTHAGWTPEDSTAWEGFTRHELSRPNKKANIRTRNLTT